MLQRDERAYLYVIELEANMATITANPTRDAGLFGRMGAAVSEFFSAVADARNMALRYDHLTHLSNSELQQLGIAREDIPQIVARGR